MAVVVAGIAALRFKVAVAAVLAGFILKPDLVFGKLIIRAMLGSIY
jgi:hypothetical protein